MSDTDRQALEELRDTAGEIVMNAVTLLGGECEAQEDTERLEMYVEHDCRRVRELADDLWR